MPTARFQTQPNGAGGWHVYDRKHREAVGFTVSHLSNATIKANRLNGFADGDRAEWFRFYGAKA